MPACSCINKVSSPACFSPSAHPKVKMKLYFSLVLMFLAVASGLKCRLFRGIMSQIDAGAGQVYGVNSHGDVFRVHGNNWERISGNLIHVTVGQAGAWGTNKNNNIFKLQDDKWVQVSGMCKQVDAGGNAILVGVNEANQVICLNKDATYAMGTDLEFNNIEGSMQYYTCGRYGCWGLDNRNDIFFRLDVTPEKCEGSAWQHVLGRMVVLEAGSDGSVYGINTAGSVYKREGISVSHPTGDAWVMLNIPGPFKSLSYDDGVLWLVNQDDNVFKCEDEQSSNSCQNNCQYCQKPLYHL